jgi:hypothetical protein
MSLFSTKSAIAYLAAVFVAGAVAGGAGGYYCGVREAMTPPGPREITAAMCDRLKSRLHLRDDQMAHIQPIIKDAVAEFRGACAGMMDKMSELARKTNERIAQYLDPNQKAELDQMERERQEFFKKTFKASEDKE